MNFAPACNPATPVVSHWDLVNEMGDTGLDEGPHTHLRDGQRMRITNKTLQLKMMRGLWRYSSETREVEQLFTVLIL